MATRGISIAAGTVAGAPHTPPAARVATCTLPGFRNHAAAESPRAFTATAGEWFDELGPETAWAVCQMGAAEAGPAANMRLRTTIEAKRVGFMPTPSPPRERAVIRPTRECGYG